MAAELDDQYFTYEERLASFQKSTKKRGSAANRGTKQLGWPHKSITPASLAEAGFYFSPTPDNPDNTVCFLCRNGLDGWEAGDDPLVEHLKHAPNCGWAVVAAIEAELDDYHEINPGSPDMIEARKATFAGRWPHESKKGWKCKTKQLVDAGWKYTPTLESEDMATCTYCQLALDGWERNDKPLDEHYKRSPNCSFFALLNQAQASTKKNARGKTARASKASRLSVQSVATVTSEAASTNEMTLGHEESVLTTSSAMTQGTKKSRAKKATTSKAKKGKAKKEEASELPEPSQLEESVAPPPKTGRGKKRMSDAIEDSVASASDAPATKKRATRTPGSHLPEASMTMVSEDADTHDEPAPKKTAARKKAQPVAAAQPTRKASFSSDVSTASHSSQRGPPGTFPDDDEIERQLQADLDRQVSDEEDDFVVHDDSGHVRSVTFENTAIAKTSTERSMFDTSPVEVSEAEIDEELKALEAEMEMDRPEDSRMSKKSRGSGGHKASSKISKLPAPPLQDEDEDDLAIDHGNQSGQVDNSQHITRVSADTTLQKATQARTSTSTRGRGRPSKASLASQDAAELSKSPELVEPAKPPVKRGRGRPSKASLASQASLEDAEKQPSEAPVKRGRGRPPKHSLDSRASLRQSNDGTTRAVKAEAEAAAAHDTPSGESNPRVVLEQSTRSPTRDEMSSLPPSSSHGLAQPQLTPAKVISPAPSARQPALSPSQSPQSSDAENQPPSSKPRGSSGSRRLVLAPVDATPVQDSPSKRNVLAGLQSSVPWTAVDLDTVLGTPRGADKENGSDRFLKQGKELTSPEKRMTVEEWIYHNAAQAEQQLRHECEMMIGRFESEGTRAMNVLESLQVE